MKENEKKVFETQEELRHTKKKLAASNEEVVFLQSGTSITDMKVPRTFQGVATRALPRVLKFVLFGV